MAKSINFKNEVYWDSSSISHNKKKLSDILFPVNSIYLSVSSTNPTNYFGGTWVQIAQGRTLVGVDTSDSDFNAVQKTGGSKYLQQHYHDVKWGSPDGSGVTISNTGSGAACLNITNVNWAYNEISSDIYTSSNLRTNREGRGDSGNLQPYFTCYIWLRTA